MMLHQLDAAARNTLALVAAEGLEAEAEGMVAEAEGVAAEAEGVAAEAEGLEVAAEGLEVEAACWQPGVALRQTSDPR